MGVPVHNIRCLEDNDDIDLNNLIIQQEFQNLVSIVTQNFLHEQGDKVSKTFYTKDRVSKLNPKKFAKGEE